MILASGGDNGYYGHHNDEPAALPTVVAVGGTGARAEQRAPWMDRDRLGRNRKRLFQEAQNRHGKRTPAARIARQTTSPRLPTRRPASQCTTATNNRVGSVIGGTSVGSPLNASVFALAGNASQLDAALVVL